jgi:hypothetical protein
MMLRARAREEQGNIVITLMVILVATGLIVGLTLAVYNNLTVTRRYGDSANALQLADAAVNDAVKDVPKAVGSTLGPTTKSLGSAGSYTYSASLDTSSNIWHVDAWGSDKSGVKRHVKAEAVPQSLFSSAFFVDSALNLPAGVSLDSFRDGSSLQNSCTRLGTLGTNDPADLNFKANGGGGNAQQGCTDKVWYGGSNVWKYPVDGCVAYHDTNAPGVWPPQYGTSDHCPPAPYTQVADPKFAIPSIQAPSGLGAPVVQQSGQGTAAQSWPQVPCDATHPIPGGVQYYLTQVTLLPGCKVQAASGPAIIYTQGAVNIGIQNGGASQNRSPGMNPPDTSNSLLCPTYAGNDFNGSPLNDYCPGWSANLQIYMTDTDTSSINFGNSATFWGVIMGQHAQIATSPQVEMWGAMRVGGLAGSAQLMLHYDEALGNITNGVYSVKAWREEPQ